MTLRIPWFVVGLVLGFLWGAGVATLVATGNAGFVPISVAIPLGVAILIWTWS